MAERKLVVQLVGDDRSLQQAFLRSSRGTKQLDRDLSSTLRGAAAGSGIFRSLGRSVAFASGGFLAFAGAGQFLRSSIDAAKEAEVTQRQLGIQLRNNGKSLAEYGGQIDKVDLKLSALSGFTKDQLDASLTTILRSTGNVSKALRDNATAADLARARHIGLAQAAFVIAKVEGGNTTLLRRQGFQIAKNATAEQALAIVRQKIAGQARAGATEQERFGAVLHDTEVIIGTGLLPTLNKYLVAGTKWLQQANESGKLQKEVASTADAVSSAVLGAADAVKTVDSVTGSFKHTLELVIGLKFASAAAGWSRNLGAFRSSASTTTGEVRTLRTALLELNLVRFGPLVATLAGVAFLAEQMRKDALQTTTIGDVVGKSSQHVFQNPNGFFQQTRTALRGPGAITLKRITEDEAHAITNTSTGQVDAEAAAKAAHGLGLKVGEAIGKSFTAGVADGTKLTAQQRNTFFDNAISRILLRGGLGSIQQQIGALQRADRLIAARLRVTKDVTRKLNLEDELLQNAAQIKSLNAQQAADALQARQDAAQAVRDRAAKRISDLTARQFRQLGLSVTGDPITPGVANLKKQLSQISTKVIGSSLDTPKLESQLARFRKVLSEGLVPKDVRAKIKEMLDSIDNQIKSHTGNLTKFSHVSSAAFVNALGLNLSADERRRVAQLFSQVGAGGTVPSQRGLAFSGAGAGDGRMTFGDVYVSGVTDINALKTELQRHSKRQTNMRRGNHAGKHR